MDKPTGPQKFGKSRGAKAELLGAEYGQMLVDAIGHAPRAVRLQFEHFPLGTWTSISEAGRPAAISVGFGLLDSDCAIHVADLDQPSSKRRVQYMGMPVTSLDRREALAELVERIHKRLGHNHQPSKAAQKKGILSVRTEKKLQLPEPGTLGAKALLQLSSGGEFTTETMALNAMELGSVANELGGLGWKIGQKAGSPSHYALDQRIEWEPERKVAESRLRSKEFNTWKRLAIDAINATPTSADSSDLEPVEVFEASDYTGYPGTRLAQPMASSPSFRLFYALMHLGIVEPRDAEMGTLALVACVSILQEAGWPVVLQTAPVRATWSRGVSASTAAAWRSTFGSRGRTEAVEGRLGAPKGSANFAKWES